MPDLKDQVINEGVRILGLCKDLKEFILSGQTRKTYLYQTEKFLTHIKKSLEVVDKFIRETINEDMDPPLAKVRLKDFDLIREGLSRIYILVKESIDSDTLSIPYSLTIFLNHAAKKIQKSRKITLVVLGSSDLMYYKYNLEYLRKLNSNLKSRIKEYPLLPIDIGILKFPYCSAQEVLANCILFHEMGHYIYEKTVLQKDFYNSIKDNLKEFIENEKVKEKIAALVQKRLFNYVINLTLRWIEEIFADVFAIRVLGPAFHLSYLELEQILTSDIKRNRSFSATHPADDFRFKIHAKWLSESGWDNTMVNRLPIIFENLNKCKELDINLFEINCTSPLEDNPDLENKLHSWMLQEFDKMIVKVEEELSAKLKDFDNPIDDFKKNDSLVTACLEHGVVPSTGYNEKKERCRPEPTTILNSGFFFYLGGMDPLLGKVKSGDSKIDKRINYGKRLNQWLTKAIEDWQFLLWKDKL